MCFTLHSLITSTRVIRSSHSIKNTCSTGRERTGTQQAPIYMKQVPSCHGHYVPVISFSATVKPLGLTLFMSWCAACLQVMFVPRFLGLTEVHTFCLYPQVIETLQFFHKQTFFIDKNSTKHKLLQTYVLGHQNEHE